MGDRWRVGKPPKGERKYLIQYRNGLSFAICLWSNVKYSPSYEITDKWHWEGLSKNVSDADVEAWRPLPDPFDVRMAAKKVEYREVEANGKIYKTAICPNCGSIFTQGSNLWLSHYCLNCGQKLLW